MTTQQNMIRGRSNTVPLLNNSGGALVLGDVCILDTSGTERAVTTTSAASTKKVYIAAESIASGATGKFYSGGYGELANVNASVSVGDYLFTHTVAKQASGSATYGAGAFGVVLKAGTSPSVWLFGHTAQTVGGAGSDTSAIHTNVANEISGVTEKTSLANDDLFIIEDSAASGVKKKVKKSNVVSGGASETPWLVQIDAPWMTPNAQLNWTVLLGENVLPTSGYMGVQSSGAQNDYIEFKVLLGAGTWEISWMNYKAANTGIFTVSIDGGSVGTVDGYNGSTLAPAISTISSVSISDTGGSAVHLLRFTMATKNGSSSGYYGNLYSVQMRRTA